MFTPIAAQIIRRASEARSAQPHAPQRPDAHPARKPAPARSARVHLAHGLHRLALRVEPR
jgi:hypothetical protein